MDNNQFPPQDSVAAPPPEQPYFSAPPPPPAEPVPIISPPQPFEQATVPQADTIVPQPVVLVLSPRGVEYVFLTISLIGGAIGLISVLISLLNGKTDFTVLAFPTALLLVSVPIFAGLFLRLKNAELKNPALGLDPSKRRSTQFIQIFSFLISFLTLIGFVTTIFAKMSGTYHGSIVKVLLDVSVILVVAGGILFYYWRDEHRA
jgi:hypothetical protein